MEKRSCSLHLMAGSQDPQMAAQAARQTCWQEAEESQQAFSEGGVLCATQRGKRMEKSVWASGCLIVSDTTAAVHMHEGMAVHPAKESLKK